MLRGLKSPPPPRSQQWPPLGRWVEIVKKLFESGRGLEKRVPEEKGTRDLELLEMRGGSTMDSGVVSRILCKSPLAPVYRVKEKNKWLGREGVR